MYCALEQGLDKYIPRLENIYRIIKPNGFVYLTELPGLFYWLLSEEELTQLKQKIKNLLGEHLIQLFKIQCEEDNPDDTFDDIYPEIITNYSICELDKAEELDKMLAKENEQFTKNLLQKYHFKIQGKKGDFLIIRPIK